MSGSRSPSPSDIDVESRAEPQAADAEAVMGAGTRLLEEMTKEFRESARIAAAVPISQRRVQAWRSGAPISEDAAFKMAVALKKAPDVAVIRVASERAETALERRALKNAADALALCHHWIEGALTSAVLEQRLQSLLWLPSCPLLRHVTEGGARRDPSAPDPLQTLATSPMPPTLILVTMAEQLGLNHYQIARCAGVTRPHIVACLKGRSMSGSVGCNVATLVGAPQELTVVSLGAERARDGRRPMLRNAAAALALCHQLIAGYITLSELECRLPPLLAVPTTAEASGAMRVRKRGQRGRKAPAVGACGRRK